MMWGSITAVGGATTILSAIGVLFLMWLVFSDDGKRERKEKLYVPGELLIYPNKNLDGFVVYSPSENYEDLFEGDIQECKAWIEAHTDYSGSET